MNRAQSSLILNSGSDKTPSHRPLWISVGIHFFFLILIVSLHLMKPRNDSQNIPIEVYEIPDTAPSQLQLQPQASKPEEKPKAETQKPREVFGLSRKSLESDSANAAVQVKAGNTVAKEMDDLKLDKNDADSIPIPADDYLVTAMPVLLSYIKPQYTVEAKSASIEGTVIVELIIDDTGKVRDAKLIRGLGFGLDERTLEAARKAQFKPGRIGEKTVAVKFRFKFKFELEN